MKLPSIFKFTVPSSKNNIVYSATVKPDGQYLLKWYSPGQQQEKISTYSAEHLLKYIKIGKWVIRDYKTNEEALLLLEKD